MRLMRTAACVLLMTVVLVAQQPAHSTHNSKHGGFFFPVAGDTLHIEAVWPEQRVFKLYVYDAAGLPLSLERLRQIDGYVEAGGVKVPLVALDDGISLYAHVPGMKPPVTMTLEIRFQKQSEPEGVGLLFPDFSNDDTLSFDLTPTVIPGTLDGLLSELDADEKEAESLAVRGQTAFMFSPALHGRDHLLALDQYVPSLDAGKQARVESAIRTAVRTAWLLHSAGDDGNDPQARTAVTLFSKAMSDVVDAFRDVKR